MSIKIRQECGLNELTLMKKMKENQALCSLLTGTGIAVDFSSNPRASNPLPVSFYNKDTGWIISPLSTGMMLENEFQLRNLPKTTEIKTAKMTVNPSHHL